MHRFEITIYEYDPADEKCWQCKLLFIDRKYLDDDGFPVDAIAAGDSWDAAFATAGEFIDKALAADYCIFI